MGTFTYLEGCYNSAQVSCPQTSPLGQAEQDPALGHGVAKAAAGQAAWPLHRQWGWSSGLCPRGHGVPCSAATFFFCSPLALCCHRQSQRW